MSAYTVKIVSNPKNGIRYLTFNTRKEVDSYLMGRNMRRVRGKGEVWRNIGGTIEATVLAM